MAARTGLWGGECTDLLKVYGRPKDRLQAYSQSRYAFKQSCDRSRVDDSRAAEMIDRITQIAHTGRMGDGKIFVLSCRDENRRVGP
ncbi:MAG TPA: P-II family nitrogen regulator [Pirellulaceae bacterium]